MPGRVLDVIQIDDPCPEAFDRMTGTGAVRFCHLCRENVYDLSQMTQREAEELVLAAEGRICVQFYRRADGTVVTKDCAPVRFAAARRAARWSLAMASAVLGGLFTVVVAVAGVFTFWRDEKPEWVVAAKDMIAPMAPMIPLPPPPPLVEPDHPPRLMRGGIRHRPPPRTSDLVDPFAED
ncbi:MAG: hypothetical protein KC619_12315 [Myxococcales bacterium]|nr:hypothetical protein [Myxococcales bacterium]